MIVVSKPLGGLFSVPDFCLSDVLSIKQERGREQFSDLMHTITMQHQVTLKVRKIVKIVHVLLLSVTQVSVWLGNNSNWVDCNKHS